MFSQGGFIGLTMRVYFVFVSVVIAVVVAETTYNLNPDKKPGDIHAEADGGPYEGFSNPTIPTGSNVIVRRSLNPRLDLPGGFNVDLDSLASQVYDKIKGEVSDAVDAAKKGLDEAIDEAKNLLGDIKNAVEDLWQKIEDVWQRIQDKVRELEDKITTTIHDWVWKHIVKPLIILLVLILFPFASLLLWWLLHVFAKPFVREREISIEMQDRNVGAGEKGREVDLPPRITRSGRGWAYWVVHSWESYGQGLICFACPWYGNFVLWRSRNRMRKDMEKLKDETSKLRAEVNWLMKRGLAQRDGGNAR